jgi:hypothetical protein
MLWRRTLTSAVRRRSTLAVLSFLAMGLAMALATDAPTFAAEATRPVARTSNADEAFRTGIDAYIYGYPLVTMDVTERVVTNTARPSQEELRAPVNQVISLRQYPTAKFRSVTAPNADTLYSSAFIDLSKEPQVLHVPAMGDRYYLMPILDGWTDVIASPGKRTGVKNAADFAITGPNFSGKLPPNVKQIKSPTNLAWLLGRIYCTGTPEDYQAVHALQDQISLKPLSAFGQPYSPPTAQIDPSVDMKTPPREQVNALDGEAYFKRLAMLMKDNPPYPADAKMVAELAKIGIVPGRDFNLRELDPTVQRALARVPQAAQQQIVAHEKNGGVRIENGWGVPTLTGRYGTNYIQRALVTWIGLGANLPEDAVYPLARADGKGRPLEGTSAYVIHFAKGQTPPVNGFWSITMYDEQMFFIDNALDKYTVSPRDPLKYNADGSLDIFLQSESPGKDKEANWLPAPKAAFVPMLRMYWPKKAVLDSSWKPPAIAPQRM